MSVSPTAFGPRYPRSQYASLGTIPATCFTFSSALSNVFESCGLPVKFTAPSMMPLVGESTMLTVEPNS